MKQNILVHDFIPRAVVFSPDSQGPHQAGHRLACLLSPGDTVAAIIGRTVEP